MAGMDIEISLGEMEGLSEIIMIDEVIMEDRRVTIEDMTGVAVQIGGTILSVILAVEFQVASEIIMAEVVMIEDTISEITIADMEGAAVEGLITIDEIDSRTLPERRISSDRESRTLTEKRIKYVTVVHVGYS